MQLRLLASCFNAIMTHLSPNIDLLQNAWALASRHHEGQIYNGPVEGEQFAYLRHIGAVMLEVQQALLLRPGPPDAEDRPIDPAPGPVQARPRSLLSGHAGSRSSGSTVRLVSTTSSPRRERLMA